MQLESITSFIQCNILIPLFLSQSLYRAQSHMNAMPTPFVLHTPSILSILIADAKPIMRSLMMAPVQVRSKKIKFFNSAIYLKPIHPGLDKFENIVFILKLPLTFPSTPCRINFAKCNSFGDRNALHLHNGNKSIISSKIRNSDLGIFEKLHFRSELVSVDGAGGARC